MISARLRWLAAVLAMTLLPYATFALFAALMPANDSILGPLGLLAALAAGCFGLSRLPVRFRARVAVGLVYLPVLSILLIAALVSHVCLRFGACL